MKNIISFFLATFCAFTLSEMHYKRASITKESIDVQNQFLKHENVKRSGSSSFNDDISFANHYFSKLTSNFGTNAKGSCPFIAGEMLLSYYDSFLNDDIIPESFDSMPAASNSFDFRGALTSPGTKNDSSFVTAEDLCGHASLKQLNSTQYWNYIYNHKDESVHLNLLSRYLDPNDPNFLPPLSTMFGGYPVPLEYLQWSIEGFINNETELDATDLNIQRDRISIPFINADLFTSIVALLSNPILFSLTLGTLQSQSNNLKNQIKNLVSRGIPVIVTGMPSTLAEIRDGLHTFIAYDYDASTDTILCNEGHVGVGDVAENSLETDYPIALEIMWFEPTIPHKECNNYICGTQAFGPSDKLYVNEIDGPESLYLDTLPTFTWDSYSNVNYYNLINKSYNLYVCDSEINTLFVKRNIIGNKYTLTGEEYDEVLSQLNTDSCRVFLELISGTEYDDQQDQVLCSTTCSVVHSITHKVQVKPGDWYFPERYYFENEGIKNSTILKDGLGITTSTLRCGYIQSSYIVLSPRRAGAGRAFFEMNFDKPVFHFTYSICLWSSSEQLDGIAMLQVKDANGNWTTIQNLLNLNLTTKEQGAKRYNVLSEPNPNNPSEYGRRGFYGIRFETTATATGTRNKGRLCIDDLLFDIREPITNSDGTTASSDILNEYYYVFREYGKSDGSL